MLMVLFTFQLITVHTFAVVRVSTPMSPCFQARVCGDLVIVNAICVLFGGWPTV